MADRITMKAFIVFISQIGNFFIFIFPSNLFTLSENCNIPIVKKYCIKKSKKIMLKIAEWHEYLMIKYLDTNYVWMLISSCDRTSLKHSATL